jgi:hypothetical protein
MSVSSLPLTPVSLSYTRLFDVLFCGDLLSVRPDMPIAKGALCLRTFFLLMTITTIITIERMSALLTMPPIAPLESVLDGAVSEDGVCEKIVLGITEVIVAIVLF